ncbi:MAG TPA: HAD hydrolase-like protein [Lacipirellulaceae bacterium]|jgi:phosphoglycolate phosphatase-like HAD superfamily hydrolase|nr:HAD hydrolase-like protein [Lacipirellulaceae bacterium]
MHICFLDIDGTLVLTGGAGQTAFARTLAEDFGVAEIDRTVAFAGRSDRAIAMDLFRSHGVAPTDENWLQFCAGYLPRLEETLATHQGSVLPGVVNLLSTLAARGDVALGLLTGNVREGARRKLGYYGLWHHFPFGGFGDEHTERCDIAAAALAAARLHLNGERHHGQVIVIGDTVHDIDCGRSIGALCVAVPTGHTTAEALRAGEPDVLVHTLEDAAPILALLDG